MPCDIVLSFLSYVRCELSLNYVQKVHIFQKTEQEVWSLECLSLNPGVRSTVAADG